MKRSKKARLRSEADKLWFNLCLKRNPLCEICFEDAQQVHHFFYKHNYPHLRYSLQNGVSLCLKCHFKLHHQDPKLITDQIIEARGKRWYNRLKKKARQKPDGGWRTIKYYEDEISRLSNML